MPTVEVTEYDFKRLQKYAEPLVDTATTAFSKVLDLLEENSSDATKHTQMVSVGCPKACVYRASSLPPLKHTKVVAGSFGETQIDKATWDALVRLALTSLYNEMNDVKMVRGGSGANVVEGKKTDEGYKYLTDFNFSYQGVSAEDAIEIVLRSARVLNVNAWVEFYWRQNEDAHLPGETGRIEI